MSSPEYASLEQTKKNISASFLGKAGIHGVGINRAERSIRVHMTPLASDQDDVIEAVRRAAGPYAVVVVFDERADIG